MAYNPPITAQGLPCKVDGEIFVLTRKDIECEFKIPTNKEFGKKTGKGKIYMTTCRIVFVNDKFATDIFKSFDIPLANLRKETFEQPVFGSNYLKGVVLPLFNLIPGPCEFKLWFKSGGCGTFLKMIDSILKQVRRNRNKGPDQRFVNDVQSGKIVNQQALFDPNDPSTIYVTQPTDQITSQQQGQFYGPNVQGNPYYQNNEPQPQQNQFNQPPQQNAPPQQQQPQQGQFQQYQAQPQQNQFQQYNPNQQQQPQQPQQPQQQQQFQPVQQNGQFQQFDQNQNQYQNNPINQQNFNQNPQHQQQINQINQPNIPQPQQEQKYFGFWGPTLQNNQQQQQAPPQQQQQQQQYYQQPQQNQFQQYNPQQQQQQQGQQNQNQNNNQNGNYPQI